LTSSRTNRKQKAFRKKIGGCKNYTTTDMEQIRGNPRDLGQNFLPFYLWVLHISISEDSQSSAMCSALQKQNGLALGLISSSKATLILYYKARLRDS
jgi:hypothetical protein